MPTCPVCNEPATYTYCSLSCSNIDRFIKNKEKYNSNPRRCKDCSTEIPYEKRHDNLFCSHTCAATYNNKRRVLKSPRRVIKGNSSRLQYASPRTHCPKCQKPTRGGATNLCVSCWRKMKIDEYGKLQLKDFKSTYARHRYQKVRHHAHRVMRHFGVPKECLICKYTYRVDLCHIVPIGAFSPDTLLSVINDITNLCYLCKNHHTELDEGALTLP